jgi:hypothetical protein
MMPHRIRMTGLSLFNTILMTLWLNNPRFDLIWTDPYPYSAITAETSEQCPGLDN